MTASQTVSVACVDCGQEFEHTFHGGCDMGPKQLDWMAELKDYVETHEALKAGRGSVDDVLGFIDWFRAVERHGNDDDGSSPNHLEGE